jgi:flagellar basal body rod protein FlgC
MNSLTELNGFVNSFSLPFTDIRLPNIIFDRPNPVNQTQSVDKGFTITGSIGIDIVEILNAPASLPSYTIDVSSLGSAEVIYASLPAGVTVTETAPGNYVINGFEDKAAWDLIKSPIIDFDDNFVGTFVYTSIITFNGPSGFVSKTWTTAVTVNNVVFLTEPTQFIYDLSAVNVITGAPLLGNLDAAFPGVTFTVVITPSSILSVNTFTTTGLGGSFSVDASTKVITISGTRTQVNSRIAGLQINANATAVDFVLTYNVTNSLNATTDQRSQILISQGLAVLGPVSIPQIFYNEDTAFVLTGAPLITDIGFDGTGTYVYTITPSTVNAIGTITATGSAGTVTFDNATKVLTIQGTRSQVNDRLPLITVTPAVDFQSNFNLNYAVVTPVANTANKVQIVNIGSFDNEVENMNINRSFIANNGNAIFATNTPQISDLDQTDPTYTIVFQSNDGVFTQATNLSPYVESVFENPLSISGTKTFVNARYSSIKFYPTAGFSGNTNFTYTQFKNSVQQLTQSVGLSGSASNYLQERTQDFISSTNYTPTQEDVRYAKIGKILLVGGGGGGSGGGGGGGEVIFSDTPINFQAQNYTITVGAGGAAGNSNLVSAGGTAGANGASTVAFGLTARGGGGSSALVSVPTPQNTVQVLPPPNGAQGGFSYNSAGAQIGGGNSAASSVLQSGFMRYWYAGGGGMGTIGSDIVLLRNEQDIDLYGSTRSINAGQQGNPLPQTQPGQGAVGRETADFANPNIYSPNYPITHSYGFGGGGGVYVQGGQTSIRGHGGYLTTTNDLDSALGTAASLIQVGTPNRTPQPTDNEQITNANFLVNGVRQPNVAGGGGGGGVLTNNSAGPPGAGGDGVVRIKIVTK